MKFEARSLGIFEILTPRQESSEVFDADGFRLTVNTVLERDVRHLVVDLSGIDYLYSDAINALVSINRRILERAGRMSLLAPQPKVREILLRSGLDSLFRIYKAEMELSAESQEILRQSTIMSKDGGSSTGYAMAIKTPAPVPQGPNARNTRRRSGSRSEQAIRRPAGRKNSHPGPTGESSEKDSGHSHSGSAFSSAFPGTFSWDEPVHPPTSPLQPEKQLEIVQGIQIPEDSTPPLPSEPNFFPPPPTDLSQDMPTLEFRIPREE
jgi:anti-anti-sigma factor